MKAAGIDLRECPVFELWKEAGRLIDVREAELTYPCFFLDIRKYFVYHVGNFHSKMTTW